MPSRTSLIFPRKSLPYSGTVTRCYGDTLFLCICLKPFTRYPLTLVQPSRNGRTRVAEAESDRRWLLDHPATHASIERYR